MSSNVFSSISNNTYQLTNLNENISGQPIIKKYWCHMCKKEFSYNINVENIDIQCTDCGKTFCEILETEDTSNQSHPINFNPFILNNNNTENNNTNNNNYINININRNRNRNNNRRVFFVIINRRRRRIRSRNSVRNISRNNVRIRTRRRRANNRIQNFNDNIDNIISHIMLNDPNKYGNPPAAKNAIEKLKKYKINEEKLKEFGFENSCGICKDEFNIGEECLLMPCDHYFHDTCLLPWLKERNSCPFCRFELPTDDADFEERKKQKLNGNNVNRQNIQG